MIGSRAKYILHGTRREKYQVVCEIEKKIEYGEIRHINTLIVDKNIISEKTISDKNNVNFLKCYT